MKLEKFDNKDLSRQIIISQNQDIELTQTTFKNYTNVSDVFLGLVKRIAFISKDAIVQKYSKLIFKNASIDLTNKNCIRILGNIYSYNDFHYPAELIIESNPELSSNQSAASLIFSFKTIIIPNFTISTLFSQFNNTPLKNWSLSSTTIVITTEIGYENDFTFNTHLSAHWNAEFRLRFAVEPILEVSGLCLAKSGKKFPPFTFHRVCNLFSISSSRIPEIKYITKIYFKYLSQPASLNLEIDTIYPWIFQIGFARFHLDETHLKYGHDIAKQSHTTYEITGSQSKTNGKIHFCFNSDNIPPIKAEWIPNQSNDLLSITHLKEFFLHGVSDIPTLDFSECVFSLMDLKTNSYSLRASNPLIKAKLDDTQTESRGLQIKETQLEIHYTGILQPKIEGIISCQLIIPGLGDIPVLYNTNVPTPFLMNSKWNSALPIINTKKLLADILNMPIPNDVPLFDISILFILYAPIDTRLLVIAGIPEQGNWLISATENYSYEYICVIGEKNKKNLINPSTNASDSHLEKKTTINQIPLDLINCVLLFDSISAEPNNILLYSMETNKSIILSYEHFSSQKIGPILFSELYSNIRAQCSSADQGKSMIKAKTLSSQPTPNLLGTRIPNLATEDLSVVELPINLEVGPYEISDLRDYPDLFDRFSTDPNIISKYLASWQLNKKLTEFAEFSGFAITLIPLLFDYDLPAFKYGFKSMRLNSIVQTYHLTVSAETSTNSWILPNLPSCIKISIFDAELKHGIINDVCCISGILNDSSNSLMNIKWKITVGTNPALQLFIKSDGNPTIPPILKWWIPTHKLDNIADILGFFIPGLKMTDIPNIPFVFYSFQLDLNTDDFKFVLSAMDQKCLWNIPQIPGNFQIKGLQVVISHGSSQNKCIISGILDDPNFENEPIQCALTLGNDPAFELGLPTISEGNLNKLIRSIFTNISDEDFQNFSTFISNLTHIPQDFPNAPFSIKFFEYHFRTLGFRVKIIFEKATPLYAFDAITLSDNEIEVFFFPNHGINPKILSNKT
jgi:hypothetical protein